MTARSKPRWAIYTLFRLGNVSSLVVMGAFMTLCTVLVE